tara:strand:+ start:13098 stop:14429 length:1332 start_codon:yes stop_codon:yes gene_type:complete
MENKKNILLISNFEKTYWYHKIFYNNFDNENIYWYVVNKKNFNFLKKFYDHQKIIYLNKKNFVDFDEKTDNFEDLKINELLFADRALDINQNNANYLKTLSTYIFKFLKKNKIEFIFGEFTWSYELIISRVAKLLNIPYYNLQSTRYPSNRFLFYSNEKQNLFYLRKSNQNKIDYREDQNQYENYIQQKNKDKNSIKLNVYKFFRLFFNDYYDKDDPTYISKIQRSKNFILKFYNKIGFNLLPKIRTQNLKNKKYLIYFLQKSPESTVDVKGMYYSDQANNIINIWKILPNDFKLIVKEHPNCVGERSIFYYLKFLKLNNIFLINLNDLNLGKESENFINNSLATFSIASTASLNSSLQNVHSFTFAETFFNCLDYSYNLSLEDLKNSKNLSDLISIKSEENLSKNDFYLNNSFEGYIIDEHLKDENNLEKIRNALNEVIFEN